MVNRKGFTLVELLAVIVVLAIVSSLAVVGVNYVIQTGKTSVYKSNIATLKTATQNYVLERMNDIKMEIDTSINGSTRVEYQSLVNSGFIDNDSFKEPNGGLCSGSYITISKKNIAASEFDYNYDVCLKCEKDGNITYESSNCD